MKTEEIARLRQGAGTDINKADYFESVLKLGQDVADPASGHAAGANHQTAFALRGTRHAAAPEATRLLASLAAQA